MPSRSWRLRIEDMLASIDRIDRYIQGMDFDGFTADDRTFDAVTRNLEVIGEAARHVPGEIAYSGDRRQRNSLSSSA